MEPRRVRGAVGVGTFFLLAAAAQAQNFSVLFSENFEAPPGPPGTVGSYTETDAFGSPGATLWHRDGFCDSVPIGGYGATPSAVPFSSIAGLPGTVLVWGAGVNDFTSSTTSLPAPFSFFSAAKTTYRLNNNGWLTFAVPGSGFGSNSPIPTTGAPDDAIFAWWDDLFTRPGGSLRSLAVPGGDLIAEWNSEEKFPGGVGNESASFQIVLHAAPANTIELRYNYASFVSSAVNPWDATVGVENAAGTGGNDLTGLGTANSVFPAQNLLLTPLPPAVPTIPASMGTGAAAYNRGDLGVYDYNTAPFANAGAIESPVVVSTAANTALYLLFDTTRQVDPGAGTTFDQSFVEVAPAGTGIWTTVTQLTASPTCTGPAQRNVLLLPFSLAGTSFQHRFRFDTLDASANGFRGWYVDNVRIDQVLAVTSPVFSENFDTGSVPGVSVGSMTEEDPATGAPASTLWHAEAFCDGGTPGSYTVGPSSTAFSSIVGSPTVVPVMGPFVDDLALTITVPILFNFYGGPVSTFNVDSNGPVSLSSFSDFTNDPIPTVFTPNGWVAAWWDDNHTGPIGSVIYDVVGGSLVIEWNSVEHYPSNSSGESATFQVRFNPSPADTIELIYDGATFTSGTDPWTSTIGIEDPTGNGGTDATGLGAANAFFPASSVLLTFVPPPGGGTPLPAPLSGLAAAYHQGDIGIYTFDTGSANEGAISSAVLPVPGGASIFDLAFDFLKEGEGGGTATFDQCFVDMRPGTAATWSTALQLTGNQTCAAGPGAVSFSATGGPFSPLVSAGTGQFRLRFDTVDGVGNAYLGWVVDNFAVNGRATAAALPIGVPCPGSGGCSPQIAGVGLPYPGNPAFELRLNGGLPGASAILVLGLSVTGPPCFLSLPFPIGVFLPGNTCSLAVCPESILPGFVVSGAAPCEGSSSLSVAIPPTAPPGATVFAQWFVIDVTVFPSPATLAASPTLLVTLL